MPEVFFGTTGTSLSSTSGSESPGKENLTCFAVAGGEAWTGGQGTMVFACFAAVDEAVVIIVCNPSVWRQLRLAVRELAEKRLSTTLSSSCVVSISLAV